MRGLIKMMAPLKRGLQQMLRIGSLLKVNDAQPIQLVQLELLSGEVIEVPRIQDFGFSSKPMKGAKGLVGAVGGKTNTYVCIKMDDKNYRPTGLKDGESIQYDAFGQYTHFKSDGTIEQKSNNQITVIVPKYRIEGDLEVTGDIIDHVDTNGQSMASMRNTYNNHDHDGDSGGITSTPRQGMSS